MIQHCVFVRFRPEISAAAKQALWAELQALVGVIPGLREVRAGANARYEDLDHGFTDGFIAVFDDRAALATYQAHPAHQATGAKLVQAALGGLQGLMVFDLDLP
ncbi:Dabb family protein [Rhodoferax sp.]|uniref:Dabb family protein n=1 Tax=Rhodoferax sp. TaxID=50421 RepID=UPI00374D0DFF